MPILKCAGLLVVIVAMAVIAGCGTSSSALDEQILTSGQTGVQTSAELQRGQKLIMAGSKSIAKGQKEQKRARKLADSGDDNVSEGRSMVSEGEALVLKARQDFCSRRGYQVSECLN